MTLFAKNFALAMFMFLSVGISACVAGESRSQSAGSLPAISPGMSGIAIYRLGRTGARIKPRLSVDGKEIAICQHKQIFYVDVPAGKHTLKAETRKKGTKTLNIHAKAGARIYVYCGTYIDTFVRLLRLSVSPDASKVATYENMPRKLSLGGHYKVR